MQSLEGRGKEFGFYSEYNADSLKVLKQGTSMIPIVFLKAHSGCDVENYIGEGAGAGEGRSIRKLLK